MSPARTHNRLWTAVVLLGDLALAVGAFLAAFLIRIYIPVPYTRHLMPPETILLFTSYWWVVVVAQLATFYVFGFYDPPRPRPALETARRLAFAVGWQALGLIAFFFLLYREFPRSVLLLFMLLNFVTMLGWRRLLGRSRRAPERRVAIVGSGPEAAEVARNLEVHHWHGLRVAGHVPAPGNPGEVGDPELQAALGPRLGEFDDLPELLARGVVDDLVIAGEGASWQTRLIDGLAERRPRHSSVLLVPGPFESLIGRMRYQWIHDLPVIEVVQESASRARLHLKRAFDLAAGSLLLAVASPVMAASALAVRVSSRGPILLRQRRVGRDRREIVVLKFRTMVEDAEAGTGEVFARPDDPRITRVGRALRRFRLDELPQLFNVLKGEMSLVGPRPERPSFVARFLREVPGYAERFLVPPGITGLAQIYGDYYSSPQSKLRYDLAYIANWSPWLDVSILLLTLKRIVAAPPGRASAPAREGRAPGAGSA